MTVSELIEELRKYSPDQTVVVYDSCNEIFCVPDMFEILLRMLPDGTMTEHEGEYMGDNCLAIECL